MKIVKAEIIVLNIPMTKSLEVSFGSIKDLKPIIIKLTDELGNIGYGESMLLPFPMTHFEYFETGLKTLEKYIIPSILNKEIAFQEDNLYQIIEDFIGNYSHIKNYEMTKVGVENAFVYILSQRLKKNIYTLFETTKGEIKTECCFGIPSNLDEYISSIHEEINKGYDTVKLKISRKHDIKLIELVRKRFPKIKISLDANQDYTFEEFKKIIPVIDSSNIEMVEQPFKYDDIISNIETRKIMKTKLCLDESICRVDQLDSFIQNGGIDILNIKIGRVGGVYSAYKINKICEKKGIGTWVGGLLETDLGRSYNLAIAGMNNCRYSNDFSMWNEFYSDFIGKDAIIIGNGTIQIDKDASGIGFEIDESKLKKYCVQKITV